MTHPLPEGTVVRLVTPGLVADSHAMAGDGGVVERAYYHDTGTDNHVQVRFFRTGLTETFSTLAWRYEKVTDHG